VAEGRAAVLWPNPTTIDFAALGEVHPVKFRFDIFTGSQQTTEVDYQLWTAEHPLIEGVQPVIPVSPLIAALVHLADRG
jgi:hypothetical protein